MYFISRDSVINITENTLEKIGNHYEGIDMYLLYLLLSYDGNEKVGKITIINIYCVHLFTSVTIGRLA